MRLNSLLLYCVLASTGLSLAGSASAAVQRHDDGFSVGIEQITPHLQQQFPWQRALIEGVLEVSLQRPELQLLDDRAHLAVDISTLSLGQRSELGRAQISSRLRLDPAKAAIYLDQPQLIGFTLADGHSVTVDAQTRGMINQVLADYAQQQPVYQLPAAYAAMAAGVSDIQIVNGRLRVRMAR
jgi:hypothetical protein